MKKIGIINLGCPRNIVDSEWLLDDFTKAGYELCEDIKDSDIAIVNTCSFIEEATKESIDVILDLIELKNEGALKKLIVAGCLSQRFGEGLKKELNEVDEFRGLYPLRDRGFPKVRLTPRHYAYVKVSEGCLNRCSFCVIPKIKGQYKSRQKEAIVEEIEALLEDGAKEIILIGQDIGSYGFDVYGKRVLAELLDEVVSISNGAWVRLLYISPASAMGENGGLWGMMREHENICKYVDLPVEHINDRILKRMARGINKKGILNLIERIRREVPDVGIRTSVIVGFPGETEEEFEELLEFLAEIRFERLGAFMYSREEGTPAFNFKDQLPQEVKKERFDRVMDLQRKVAEEVNRRFLNRKLAVLIDEKKEDGLFVGRTQYDSPEVDGEVFVKGDGLKPGDFAIVKIIDTYEYDLVSQYEPA